MTRRAKKPTPLIVNDRQPAAIGLLAVLTVCALLAGAWSVRSWSQTAAIRNHLERADAAIGKGQAAVAMAEWRNTLRLDPQNPRIYEMMVQYAMQTGQWAPAADALRAFVKAIPQTKHIYCRLAACQLRQGDQKGAYDAAQEELKHDPDCVAALGLITSVMALQSSPDTKLRMEYLIRLARLAPNDIDFLHMLAEAQTNLYRYDELRPVVEQILKIDPRDAEAYNLLGYADLASPNQPAGVLQAKKDFETSLALNPANGGAHFGLGKVELRLGHGKEAVVQFEEALRMRPEAIRINFDLSSAYRMAGMPQKALEANHRYLQWQYVSAEQRKLQVRGEVDPQNPRYPRELGLLLANNGGNPSEAAYYLRRALQLAPGDATAKAALERLQPSSNSFRPEQSASASSPIFR